MQDLQIMKLLFSRKVKPNEITLKKVLEKSCLYGRIHEDLFAIMLNYEEEQENDTKAEIPHSYKDVTRILENVVNSGDETSFDTLEEAIYSEQQSSLHRSEDSGSEHIIDNFVQKYSNEALKNAEVLLKEMLEKS